MPSNFTIPPPLYDPYGNAINPDFYSLASISFTAVVGAIGLYQLLEITLAKEYGPNKIKYNFGSSWKPASSGILQQFRLGVVAIQTLTIGALAFLNFDGDFFNFEFFSLLVSTLVTGLVFLPLQVLEPTKSIAQLSSVLIYWFGKLFFNAFSLAQDVFSEHSIYSKASPVSLTLEIVIFLSTAYVLVSEVSFWKPTEELLEYYNLNEWKSDTRNLFSFLTYSWAQPMIASVYKTDTVVFEELPDMPSYISAENTSAKLQNIWDSALFKAKQKQAKEILKAKKKNPEIEEKDLPKVKVSLFIPLVKAFSWLILTVIIGDLFEICFTYSQPFLLQWFIRFFTDVTTHTRSDSAPPPPPKIIGYFIGTLIYLTSVVRYFLVNQLYMFMFCLAYCYQTSLTSMIYNKALKLTPEARKEKTAGDVVNNVTMDTFTIQWFCCSLQDFVSTPIKIVLCIVSLHKIIGNATYGGLITTAILIPLSAVVSASFMSLYPLLMKHKDERTSLITEILNSVKSIKLYSWEKPMLERLSKIRNEKELKTLKKIGIYSALSTFLWQCIPFFVSCSSFATFVWLYDIPLTPDIVFPALSLFDMLTEPIFMLPNIVTNMIEARTSIGRLHELFLLDELDDQFIKRSDAPVKLGEVSVSVSDATFVWTKKKKVEEVKPIEEVEGDVAKSPEEQEETIENTPEAQPKSEYALTNINFTAKKGQLTCVVGKVGSGKSTLFKALLGEVPLSEGSADKAEIKLNGSIAYCSQSPWILNGTVKENILFGCKYEKEFYLKTIDACELTTDFKVLPDGDQTVVGEKGISLSGGQKARIALARAVYSKSDIYFFDDVLSAVDAHVGKNIISKVLGPNGIIKSKTKVLATNSVPVLHDADLIYMLKGGEFVERGNFEDVMERGSDLATLITEFGRKDNEKEETEKEIKEDEAKQKEEEAKIVTPTPYMDVVDEAIVEFTGDEVALQRVISNETIGRASLTSYSHVHVEEEDSGKKKTGNNDEESEKGKVKLAIFIEYFRACNFGWVSVYLICTLIMMIITVGEKALLTQWSEENAVAGETVRTKYFLTFYLALGVIGGILNLLAAFVLWSLCIIRGAKYFHETMAKSILRSPMRFFETTPVGRILNRFTDDIGTIDMQLPWIFMNFLTFLLNGVVTFTVICYNLPVMTIILGFLLIIYNQIRKYFIPCSRELKRLQSKSKSPQFAHIQESINGIDTVKAYNQADRFIFKNKQNIDKVITIGYLSQACNRWLSIRLQTISSILIYASSLLSLLSIGGPNEINSSLLGFIMVYALSITYILNAVVRMWAEVETQSVAVERLVEYCNLPSEAPEIIEDNRPPVDWPSKGEIKFVDYSTRYAENLDNVLKNINIEIKSNEKVGIVGRTGAGKSSLTLALFRIIESTGGYIEIDGVDTSKIGLSDLRHQLSIIPQDAHTVEGSVRQNLDPFQEYDDDKLWHVLELAHLKEHVKTMKTEPTEKEKKENKTNKDLPTKYELDATIFEGGSNLSAGQKQLLCLARALLNPSKVLLLDEATAAVDVQTDKIIQETIRNSFKDKTILIIAHRLETIMDSDRVLVLDLGQVKEFDSPENLLKDKEGIFYSLCKEGGYLPGEKADDLEPSTD
ncbi:multiple drug resistance-associated protein-like transporter 1 [[Candida] railenensis]|uniref:Multiple drug resistance-associated protein-like transporter 1 n=1 Tax=[Candida] railenensis TaxID=45579 RepID=A0A9P0VWL7_9ASCO|nr:multiple drug resistance-associated protein-like transporter 1 [[Candida] railenensis]